MENREEEMSIENNARLETMQMAAGLVNLDSFFDQFIKNTRSFDTYEESYEAVEKVYQKAFGVRRFKNYDSFRNARKYHLKKGKK